MSNFIYQTPDKKYRIQKQNDPIWIEIFGEGSELWHVLCYDQSLYDSKFSSTGYYILWSGESIKECFEYLVEHKAISKEEMKLHETLFGVAIDKKRVMW
jgi:hypothetical protein